MKSHKRRAKYNNKKTVVDGITFASKSEAAYYRILKEQKARGEILDFELQKRFEVIPAYKNATGEKIRAMYYVCDFFVTQLDSTQTIEDVKGSRGYTTPEFKQKKKIFEFLNQDKYIRIVTV